MDYQALQAISRTSGFTVRLTAPDRLGPQRNYPTRTTGHVLVARAGAPADREAIELTVLTRTAVEYQVLPTTLAAGTLFGVTSAVPPRPPPAAIVPLSQDSDAVDTDPILLHHLGVSTFGYLPGRPARRPSWRTAGDRSQSLPQPQPAARAERTGQLPVVAYFGWSAGEEHHGQDSPISIFPLTFEQDAPGYSGV